MSESTRSSESACSGKRRGWLLGFGHPLMDMTTNVDETFLAEFHLKRNDAILADSRFDSLMNQVISGDKKVQLSAGGSTQNTIRVAQAVISSRSREELVTCFVGSVGSDDYGEQMKYLMQSDSVDCRYQVKPGESTGVCLVLLSNGGLDRSLVTSTGAANSFEWTGDMDKVVARSRIIYSSGFTLCKLMHVNEQLARRGKIFSLNLSSDYVTESYADRIMQLLPSIGILFGNCSEVKSLAEAVRWPETSLAEIIDKLTRVPNSIVGCRVIVITSNCEPIYLATWSQLHSSARVKRIPVPQVSPIIDTNCAGDAFAGGFLAYLIENAFDTDGNLITQLTFDSAEGTDILTSAAHSAIRCAQAIMQSIGCDTSRIRHLYGTN